MKNRWMNMAGALALLAILGKFYATPALAQVRAALTKSIDEKGRTPYIESRKFDCNSTCTIDFSPVPAGRRLVVEHVNIGFFNTTEDLVFWLSWLENPIYLDTQLSGASSRVVNSNVLLYYEPLSSLNLHYVGGRVINTTATISGYFVDLTQ